MNYMDIYRARLLSARLEGGKSEIEEAVKAVFEAAYNQAIDDAAGQIVELGQLKAVRALRIE